MSAAPPLRQGEGFGDTIYLFVDEAGDPTLFESRRGKVLVGTQGCSRFFIMGKLEVDDPAGLAARLEALRAELLADAFFADVESFRPERKKTAVMFHAKDDLPEVRYRVFHLLRAQGKSIRFHAVVRDKLALVGREIAKRTADPTYRYQPNALYDDLVHTLFSRLGRFADRYELAIAKRGHKDRNEALLAVLKRAETTFETSYGFARGGEWHLTLSDPKTTACLQAADYFLWSLQRFYEDRLHPQTGATILGEPRYLNVLWPQIAEVHDLDAGMRGTTFGPRRPLTREARFPAGAKKKEP